MTFLTDMTDAGPALPHLAGLRKQLWDNGYMSVAYLNGDHVVVELDRVYKVKTQSHVNWIFREFGKRAA